MSLFLTDLVWAVLQLLTLAIIVRAALSWIPNVDYEHPLVRAITRVTDPILKPVRRLLPLVEGWDLSPIAALILLWLVGTIVIKVLATLSF
jgi:YggT family protein